MSARVDAEFEVAAADVLRQRVTTNDHARRTIAFESTHGTESGLEPTVVALDAVVRVPLHCTGFAARSGCWSDGDDVGAVRGGLIERSVGSVLVVVVDVADE